MEPKEKKETAAQVRAKELLDQRHLTVDGKFTIPELNQKYGLPKAILKYAKVEALTGLTSTPTTTVERWVDGELFYTEQVVIRGIPKSVLLQMEYNGIATEYVRHPTYDPAKMIKASDKEVMGLRWH